MKKLFLLLLTFFTITLFVSCASTSKETAPRERDETFIADISSFKLDTLHLYTQLKTGKPKINDLSLYFDPKTNFLIVNTKIGIDYVRLGFTYDERKALFEAYNKYIEDYENGTIPTEKPTKKNAYTTGMALIGWGVTNYSYEADSKYITNAYYLTAEKPYFRLYFNAGADFTDKSIYSPVFSIYISPAQWETILELCNQEALEARVDEILEEADAF